MLQEASSRDVGMVASIVASMRYIQLRLQHAMILYV